MSIMSLIYISLSLSLSLFLFLSLLHTHTQIVTCSELATMVATENNTFLIWGSRPVIQSPLSCLLSNDNKTLQDSKTR